LAAPPAIPVLQHFLGTEGGLAWRKEGFREFPNDEFRPRVSGIDESLISSATRVEAKLAQVAAELAAWRAVALSTGYQREVTAQ